MVAKVALLDIEGTVCPISFVKDVLFPYALEVLPDTLESEWDSAEFAQYRNAFPSEYAASQTAFVDHVKDLMSRDVKIAYLKSLQGYLWLRGYETGQLKAPLFPDVAPKFAMWGKEGVQIMIYSSGSVPAQKLLFRYTNGEPADLTPKITDYFDTVNAGPKQEASSYERIAAKYPEHPAADWLFLSDNVKEVEAAKKAGMQGCIVERPGNAELSDEARKEHAVIQSFEALPDL
ncbi:enolase-phosphatase E1 [Diplogelasinospora grovesii]|uniref:Enolase-phosphatase E1 n=1 Tax=Diplogelasinospora grovesii TaxID=303347 RepID=A0AAN6NJ83_9PEZI|nr:enolase-phosphatase E1 [Diplogelasinospora grovesii]